MLLLRFCLDFAIVTQTTSLSKSCKAVFEISVALLVEVAQTEGMTFLKICASDIIALRIHYDLLFLFLSDSLKPTTYSLESWFQLLDICRTRSYHMRLIISTCSKDKYFWNFRAFRRATWTLAFSTLIVVKISNGIYINRFALLTPGCPWEFLNLWTHSICIYLLHNLRYW